ncbi:CCHC-type zinc finger nucleic acid binding protein-like [Macrobrachium nipponense]|uniref:CCHC-type zinc finger nucleic acid binding protein-like n=1 Tax=Macrobrachium nipponense TaxID=159736 RepID=UPI0030C8C080
MKEKMRWTNERLTWNDILEIVEDYEFDKCMKESRSVSIRTEVNEGIPEFRSYREAVLEGLRQMAEQAADRSIRASNVCMVKPTRDRSVSVGRLGSVSCERVQKCYRYGKAEHKKNECQWALGACFRCGKTEHLVSGCQRDKEIKCYRCGQTGHVASGCQITRVNVVCYNCGKNGHYTRICKEQRAKCAECGMEGHVARAEEKVQLWKCYEDVAGMVKWHSTFSFVSNVMDGVTRDAQDCDILMQ